MNNEKMTNIVEKAQKGDQNALNELANECYADIYYYVLKTVKNPDIAADATQETFVEIMTTISKLREPAAFAVWARRIAYHQCTRYFKENKEVLLEENEDGETLLDVLPDEDESALPEKVVEDKELRRTVLSMLDTLPAEQRSAMVLYYYEKLSLKQIADIQNTTEGTVKSRLNYGRKAVKNEVEAYEKKTGTKLRGIIVLPIFLRFVYKSDKKVLANIQIPDLSGYAASGVASGVASKSEKAAVSGVNTAKAVAGAAGAKKAIGAVLALLIAGGIGVGIFFALKGNDENNNNSSEAESALDAWAESSVVEESSREESEMSDIVDVSETSEESVESSEPEAESSVDESSEPEAESSEPEHVHEFDSKWKTNTKQHWQVCECGEEGEKENHSFSGAKCTICDYMKPTENLSFEKTDGGYMVVYSDNLTENDTDIVIPAEYKGKPVVAIGVSAFQSRSMIKTVYIPDTVKSIGNAAFMGCESLVEINLPDSITQIDEVAFAWCISLKEIKLPKKLKTLKFGTFQDCSALETVIVPKSVETIQMEVFNFCNSLKSIEYGGTLAKWEEISSECVTMGSISCNVKCSDGETTLTFTEFEEDFE